MITDPEQFDLKDMAPIGAKDAYIKGVKAGAIYLIMTWDEDHGSQATYVMPGEDIGQMVKWCYIGAHVISEHDLTKPFEGTNKIFPGV